MHTRPRRSSSSSGSPSHDSSARNRTPDLSTSTRQRPKSDDVPKIQKLTRELWDLRRQVTAGVVRETTILKELKALNAPYIPESSSRSKLDDETSDYIVVGYG